MNRAASLAMLTHVVRTSLARGLWLAAAACLTSCAAAGQSDLTVDVRTDFRPFDEFRSVRTELLEATMDGGDEAANTRVLVAQRSQNFLRGNRVAEYRVSPPFQAVVRVTLVDADGRAMVARETQLRVTGAYALTVVITRDCLGVRCPGAGDPPSHTTCFGGRCVDPHCRTDDPASCGMVECTEDADCPRSSVACAELDCISGACLAVVRDDACAATEWCSPTFGCLPRSTEDAGPPRDAGPRRDAGPPQPPRDAGPPDASVRPEDGGPLACANGRAECDGNPATVCEADLTQPEHCGSCTNRCDEFHPICRMTLLGAECVDQCHDTVQNGAETDTDCGGPSCPRCAAGSMCTQNTDCTSGLACNGGSCGCSGECIPGRSETAACGMCGSRSRTCRSDCTWGPYDACRGEGVCPAGSSESRACGMCGSSTRICQADCQWGAFVGCAGEGVCVAGTTERASCGMCGGKTRTCGLDCRWGAYSACGGEGVCTPGAVDTQPCGRCGTKTRVCGSDCQFGAFTACSGEGVCTPGQTDATGCGTCQTKTCTSSCTWPDYCNGCTCGTSTICGSFCPSGFHDTRHAYSGSCGGSCCANNQVTCEPSCGASFSQCGTFCPPGYHETRIFNSLSCGSGTSSNAATCESDALHDFTQCGTFCPPGYHETRVFNSLNCGTCCANNTAACSRDDGASFDQCGTSCPPGYSASRLYNTLNCGACCANNAATCIRIGG